MSPRGKSKIYLEGTSKSQRLLDHNSLSERNQHSNSCWYIKNLFSGFCSCSPFTMSSETRSLNPQKHLISSFPNFPQDNPKSTLRPPGRIGKLAFRKT